MSELGRVLIAAGALLLAVGIVLTFAGQWHLPLGRLPGDFTYRGKHTTFFFPLTTCIILSVVLSLVFYLLGRLHR
jgi:hypothetical protein